MFRPRCRPTLEALEDRALLATVYVVPANVPTDGLHVHSLQDAIIAIQFEGFDTIQIEPNSVPGAFDFGPPGGNLPQSAVIQGDPNYPLNALPRLDNVDLNSFYTPPETNFFLAHLNLSFVEVTNGQLSDDTITGTVSAMDSQGLLVQNCKFSHSASATGGMLELSGANSAIVSNNTFTSAAVDDTAVAIDSSVGVTVSNNTIKLTGGGSFAAAILVQNHFADTGVDLNTNVIQTSTKGGIGVLTSKASGNTLNLRLEGNDLRQNFVGLGVIGDGTYLGNIDAGSTGGSPGGNKFQGFTPNPNGREAIETLLATTGTVQAHFNTWSVFDPQTAVDPTAGTTIATGSSISFVPSGVLAVFLDLSAFNLDMRDNGLGGIGVAFDRGAEQTFSGVRQIMVESGNGGHSVAYALLPADRPGEILPAVRPADLRFALGAGNDTLQVSALAGWGSDTTHQPWHIAVTGGAGVERSTFLFGGHLGNLDLEDQLGKKQNTVDVRIDPGTAADYSGTVLKMNFLGTGGADSIHALIGSDHVSGPGPINRALLTAALDLHFAAGRGMSTLSVEYRNVVIDAPQRIELTGAHSEDALRLMLNDVVVSAPLEVRFSGGPGWAVEVGLSDGADRDVGVEALLHALHGRRRRPFHDVEQ
jgi:hypothetical protein